MSESHTSPADEAADAKGAAVPAVSWAGMMLDCPDAGELATFYGELTGWGVGGADDGGAWAFLSPPGVDIMIGFQRVADYQPPRWPSQDAPQQFHLDFRVADLAASIARARQLGATPAGHQPGGERWQVMLDPAGHPFCLCPVSSAAG
ncbi:VOC family protein [Frankia sp. R82]|uniref:VOC family protein n=1 Tax=Frankia sp. R82 TaxID=2950553 RepID=UPI002044A987|nr:VOC family protein [Frankia sp. R82]MCM3885758.1 VOC family protein [Frankia sp. R82]